jgi:hypothetical protein
MHLGTIKVVRRHTKHFIPCFRATKINAEMDPKHLKKVPVNVLRKVEK